MYEVGESGIVRESNVIYSELSERLERELSEVSERVGRVSGERVRCESIVREWGE